MCPFLCESLVISSVYMQFTAQPSTPQPLWFSRALCTLLLCCVLTYISCLLPPLSGRDSWAWSEAPPTLPLGSSLWAGSWEVARLTTLVSLFLQNPSYLLPIVQYLKTVIYIFSWFSTCFHKKVNSHSS